MLQQSTRPIAYVSRSLTHTEKNYVQVEKEVLALVFAVKKFHQYLYGLVFTLLTDHKPLLTIFGPKKGIPFLAAARLQHWAVLLSAYSYLIEYKSTNQHSNADALSRLPLPEGDTVPTSNVPSCFNIGQIEALPIMSEMVREGNRQDPLLSKVLLYTKSGWPSQIPDCLKPFLQRKPELSVEGGCLLWGIRVIIPHRLQDSILTELHQDHSRVIQDEECGQKPCVVARIGQGLGAGSCKACHTVKQRQPITPLHPWIWPTKLWQRIHVDFAGPFMSKFYFLVVDAYSKWLEIFQMSSTTTEQIKAHTC